MKLVEKNRPGLTTLFGAHSALTLRMPFSTEVWGRSPGEWVAGYILMFASVKEIYPSVDSFILTSRNVWDSCSNNKSKYLLDSRFKNNLVFVYNLNI